MPARRLATQEPDDERLCGLVAGGDDGAVATLDRRYRQRLEARARDLGAGHAAEDAAQVALTRAITALRTGTRPTDARAWLFTLASNAARDLVRARATRLARELESGGARVDVSVSVEQRERLGLALAAIDALPANQRQALLLTVAGELSQREIARRLRVPEDAVRGILHRARRRVRRACDDTPGHRADSRL